MAVAAGGHCIIVMAHLVASGSSGVPSGAHELARLCGVAGSTTTRRRALVVGLTLAGGLTGCADFYLRYRDFQEGWRTGEIVEIGRASAIQHGHRTDCRDTSSTEELAARRFATLVDRSTGQRHAHVVMLDAATPVSLGDTVSTNVIRCGTPIRVLSHSRAPSG